MEYLVPKATADTVAYYIDWSKQLQPGDYIASFTLTVTSGTVTIVQAPEQFGVFIRALIEGGANGETAVLSCTVNTFGLQELSREISLYVSDGAQSVTPSTVTKRTIVNMTFEEIGLAGYEFDATPEEQASLLRRLDAMQAEWRTNSLDLNYNAPPVIGTSDLADESGIPDDALTAVVTSLALRACPAIGKTMSLESRQAYQDSMTALRTRYLPRPERALPFSTPRGAGQKPWGVWYPYGYFGPAFPRRC